MYVYVFLVVSFTKFYDILAIFNLHIILWWNSCDKKFVMCHLILCAFNTIMCIIAFHRVTLYFKKNFAVKHCTCIMSLLIRFIMPIDNEWKPCLAFSGFSQSNLFCRLSVKILFFFSVEDSTTTDSSWFCTTQW